MELRNRSGLDYTASNVNLLMLMLLERRIQIHKVLQRQSKTGQNGVATFLITRESMGKCLPVDSGRQLYYNQVSGFLTISMSVILQTALGFGRS